jgi:hypothetical protein
MAGPALLRIGFCCAKLSIEPELTLFHVLGPSNEAIRIQQQLLVECRPSLWL